MFVTFEGGEGAGKSTVIGLVADHLKSIGYDVLVTREPGSGRLGSKLRAILLEGDPVDEKAELLLFLADRAQHVADVIRPALEASTIVLCDRFTASTIAYQGHGRGMDLELLRNWNEFATGGLKPDLTLLFDLDPVAGLARVACKDRLDSQPLDFHSRVREAFLNESRLEPQRWAVLDASKSLDEVTAAAIRAVDGVRAKAP